MSGILDTFFNLSYMLQVVPDILRVGYYNTITISLYSTIIGIIIGAPLSLIVVRIGLPRIMPARPLSRIGRSTVQRAIGKPSRFIWRHAFRTP